LGVRLWGTVFETVRVANTSCRDPPPYRKALDAEVALAKLLRGRGTQWDPQVVDAFAETLPGAVPADARARWTEFRPLLRSLGAAVGVIG
jgi:hypothetical protein